MVYTQSGVVPEDHALNEEPQGITVQGDTLRARGELGPQLEAAFEEATSRLLESAEDPLVIDLTGVRYVNSTYVRHIAAAALDASKLGRRIRLMATRRAMRVFEFAGLQKMANVDVVPTP